MSAEETETNVALRVLRLGKKLRFCLQTCIAELQVQYNEVSVRWATLWVLRWVTVREPPTSTQPGHSSLEYERKVRHKQAYRVTH